MTDPVKASTGTLGSVTKMSLWFSEDITAASGSITVMKSAPGVSMSVTHSNVTITGSKMEIKVDTLKLNSAGTWKVIIPAGTLKDSAGNLLTGVNASDASKYEFSVDQADSAVPTLTTGSILPASEGATPTYTVRT